MIPILFAAILVGATYADCLAGYQLIWEGIDANTAGARFVSALFEEEIRPYPLGDFDGDNRIELACMPIGTNTLIVRDALTGQQEGSVPLPNWGNNALFAPIDLDRDGWPEIVLFGQGANGYTDFGVVDWMGVGAVPADATSAPQAVDVAIRPNPFNPLATIEYSLAGKGNTTLRVYDAAGRLARTLVDGPVEAGKYSIPWDGRDNTGHVLASGTYFYRLELDGKPLDAGKAVILK